MKKNIILLLSLCSLVSGVELILPIPQSIDVDSAKASLGKDLFFDTRLSKNNTISCATCHQLENGGDDNMPVSIGINGYKGTINAPTVYNAVFNFRQFWDGRAKDLEEQATAPIENPVEMGHDMAALVNSLESSEYKQKFANIYADGITPKNIANAIAEYEKTLITPNAPFDLFLKGYENALTLEQKEGYELFKTKGCIACHHGVNIGGNSYNKFGIFQESNVSDFGRFNVTHKERDKYYFKVPSLRNVEYTAPYFHDGRTADLKEAVLIMAQYQLGRKITDEEANKITAFLRSLSGEIPKDIEQ